VGKIPVRPGSKKFWKIYGKWTENIKIFNEETNEEMVIWEANQMMSDSDWNYYFNHFGVNLNHFPERLK